MALEVVWSKKALDNFHNVISYLEKNWNDQVIKDFVTRTEKVIWLIAQHPQMFREISNLTSIREAVITKHNLLLYRFSSNRVELLAVFDTRQHPRKKKI